MLKTNTEWKLPSSSEVLEIWFKIFANHLIKPTVETNNALVRLKDSELHNLTQEQWEECQRLAIPNEHYWNKLSEKLDTTEKLLKTLYDRLLLHYKDKIQTERSLELYREIQEFCSILEDLE